MNRNPIFIAFGLLSAFLLIGCEEEVPRVEAIRPVLAMKVQDGAALNRRSQSRTICRPTPPIRAASPREPPS